MSDSYPPDPTVVGGVVENARDYRDDAAVQLYKDAEASRLVGVHIKLMSALDKQAAKLDTYSHTPYSEEHGELIATTTRAVAAVEEQLERWHHLIYPNQR
jgi:hypothetical protein